MLGDNAGEKVAKTTLNNETLEVEFAVGDEPVHATVLPGTEGVDDDGEFVVGVHEPIGEDGNREERRYLRLPRCLMEARQTTVEFYDSHDKLVKRIGAIGIVAGAITVGSLVVHRFHHRTP